MLKIDNKIEIEKALLLAPMEDITDISYRKICKDLGADIVYTEFVNCEGLVRQNEKTHKKLKITDAERPVGIQIYGDSLSSMVEAAKIAEKENPDIIDINAGCWVKKVAGRGAGAALLKNLPYLTNIAEEIVKAVKIPVTVKTRIGWDSKSIRIVELAKMLEDVGIQALTVHCRTREQAHNGEADWSWIDKIKNKVKIPIILNGGILTPEDVKKAFEQTGADGVMIARGAIENPWIFEQAKKFLKTGSYQKEIPPERKIQTLLLHLKDLLVIKDERRAIIEFRKFYTGYLKGLPNVSKLRVELMKLYTYNEVEKIILEFAKKLEAKNK